MYSQLSFKTLRKANLARLPLFRNAKGELAHSKPDGSDWSPADWMTALAGEVGELANLMKKVRRGDLTHNEALVELGRELADVQTYLDILAFQLGVDLGDATARKFNDVSMKVRAPVWIMGDTVVDAIPGEGALLAHLEGAVSEAY